MLLEESSDLEDILGSCSTSVNKTSVTPFAFHEELTIWMTWSRVQAVQSTQETVVFSPRMRAIEAASEGKEACRRTNFEVLLSNKRTRNVDA